MVALVLLSYGLLLSSLRGLHISVRVSRTRLISGDDLEETYVFTKDSMWPTLWAEIVDHDFERDSVSVRVAAGGECSVRRRRLFAHRGWYELGARTVRVRDPLGLFARICQVSEPVDVIVYPRPQPSPEAVQAAQQLSSSQQRRRLAEADATRGDLREYVPGDAPSRIHWRTSARQGTLMVADPESLQQRALWLLIDLTGSPELVERAASVAAYLANALFRQGHAVGAIVMGRDIDVIPASRSRGQLGWILEALALSLPLATSRLDQLIQTAAECNAPGAFLLVSASPRALSAAALLRPICPAVRVVPVESRAAEASA